MVDGLRRLWVGYEEPPPEEPHDALAVDDISPRLAAVLVLVATAIGAVTRLAPLGGRPFPLNDGGLVYELVKTLQAHNFAAPLFVNYNGIEIPFASPPIPLFMIGLTSNALHIPVDYAQTLVALAISVLTVPLVYPVAHVLLGSRQAAVGAVLAYALLPRAFEWLVTGGGVGRGVALLFILLCIHQAMIAMRTGKLLNALNAGGLLGLTVLSVPRAAGLLALSLVLLGLLLGRRPRTLLLAGVALVVAALVSWTWVGVVISRYGVGALTSAIIAGSNPATSLKTLLSFELSGAPILDVMSILGVVGAVALLVERRIFLVIWFLLLFSLDQRAGTSYAMIPFACMAGYAATEVVVRWPRVWHLTALEHRWDRLAAVAMAAVLLLTALLGSLTATLGADSPLHAVDDEGLTGMAWVRTHLNPESRVVVLEPNRWETDAYGAWFPALTGMQNLAAVQGYEWLGLSAFGDQQARHDQVQECVNHTIDCVESWLKSQDVTADYVVIPKLKPGKADCCPAARESLRSSPNFRVVYDGPGATVAAVLGSGAQLEPVLVGAGDIADCDSPGAASTAALIQRIPGTVFAAGDNAYETGTADEYAQCYDPTWGRFKDRTRPVPGNHEYRTPGAAPYYAYWGATAGTAGEGWYSFDLGTWHVVMLNSECEVVGCGMGSAQLTWLKADLASHPTKCMLAIWHEPLFTSGEEAPALATRAFWDTLYAAGADVVINGHNHDYERFAPQAPDGTLDRDRGIREFVVGTGGKNLLPFGAVVRNTEVRNNTTFGVIKLTLHTASYDWQFIPVVNGAFADHGTGTCH